MLRKAKSWASLQMAEGRRCQVQLLDDRKLEFLIQPKLQSSDLLDLVASHFNLKEKEYFGLAYHDETHHLNWLQADRRVLEHEFPRRAGTLTLQFAVRFYIESIAYLRDPVTIELFFLQAKSSIFKGQLEVDSETAFELAAYVLQATHGDYTSDENARNDLKKLPVLPTSALKEHPSLSYCEDRVIAHYKKFNGQSRGQAIVNYMSIVESVPNYGVHYYEVKDKGGIPWWLGLSYKGIAQYDHSDKLTPRKIFQWRQLENLYFREKKFSIEVHDPRRVVHALSTYSVYDDALAEPLEELDDLTDAISDPSTLVSVSRRTFSPSSTTVHAWYASPNLIRSMWSMAISQHQFYLDRKQSKARLPHCRSLSEIAADLTDNRASVAALVLSSPSSEPSKSEQITASSSFGSLPRTNSFSSDQSEPQKQLCREMYAALRARKETLEDQLKLKTEALKQLCIKEAEITGVLSSDIPLKPGESPPQIRRRVGTAFTYSSKVVEGSAGQEAEADLERIEREYEILSKITSAALRLANDPNVAKKVRKKRKESYQKSLQKLKTLEAVLNHLRKQTGMPAKMAPYAAFIEDLDPSDSSSVSDVVDDDEQFPPTPETKRPQRPVSHHATSCPPSPQKQLRSATSTPSTIPRQHSRQIRMTRTTSMESTGPKETTLKKSTWKQTSLDDPDPLSARSSGSSSGYRSQGHDLHTSISQLSLQRMTHQDSSPDLLRHSVHNSVHSSYSDWQRNEALRGYMQKHSSSNSSPDLSLKSSGSSGYLPGHMYRVQGSPGFSRESSSSELSEKAWVQSPIYRRGSAHSDSSCQWGEVNSSPAHYGAPRLQTIKSQSSENGEEVGERRLWRSSRSSSQNSEHHSVKSQYDNVPSSPSTPLLVKAKAQTVHVQALHVSKPSLMTCEPVRSPASSGTSTPRSTSSTPHRNTWWHDYDHDSSPPSPELPPRLVRSLSESHTDTLRDSYSFGEAEEGLAEAFSEEMLQWIEGQESMKPGTLV
ncbi:PREDICTED: FERM domain-containing protein 4A-like isoform X2 [Branchiostoma belcheri]|uniref:FERM domain-containing protein 4A-like isoform X2 n=1 Tax=Branchiostoma belcheri TaxID=7741 RepID=A0A6P4Y515_BRABE|nr:PREDICTED: FERM domain-containing protein 4A-like isoform X2 [Branchiostoma belcheri]